jgi:hypothetical protein
MSYGNKLLTLLNLVNFKFRNTDETFGVDRYLLQVDELLAYGVNVMVYNGQVQNEDISPLL